jgi:hypothetical protein
MKTWRDKIPGLSRDCIAQRLKQMKVDVPLRLTKRFCEEWLWWWRELPQLCENGWKLGPSGKQNLHWLAKCGASHLDSLRLLHEDGGIEEWLRQAEERGWTARLKGSTTKMQFGPDTPVTIAVDISDLTLCPGDLICGRTDLSRSINSSVWDSLVAENDTRCTNSVRAVRIKQFIVDDFRCFSTESWDAVIKRFREHLKAKGYKGREALYQQSPRNRNPRPKPVENGSGGWNEIFAAIEAVDCGTLLNEKPSDYDRRTISSRLKRPKFKPHR